MTNCLRFQSDVGGATAAGGSDFLSSALSAAQIDLQPYQFMEDDDDSAAKVTAMTGVTSGGEVLPNTTDEESVLRVQLLIKCARIRYMCITKQCSTMMLCVCLARSLDADRRCRSVDVTDGRQ